MRYTFDWSFTFGCLSGLLMTLLMAKLNDRETNQVAHKTAPRRDRIFCWVVTTPQNKMKAMTVKETWGRKCDKLLFMSSKNDTFLPAFSLPISEESRDQLWNKAKLTFRLIYDHYLDDYYSFFKADDDTYAIMENMREYLSTLNPTDALFIGHEFGIGDTSFLSGGAGYVLSRETMRPLVEKGLGRNVCPTHFKGEEDDVTITQCLYKLGVTIPDTKDHLGHHRFLSCDVEQFYNEKVGPVHCRPHKQSLNCLSKRPITFHYVPGKKMIMYEYLLYQAQIADPLGN